MKSRTSKSSAGDSKRKGPSRTAKILGATTVGALAGGILGAAITNRSRTSSAISKTARKLKSWAKSAATNPTVKSLAKGVAEQAVASRLSNRPSRKGQATPSGRAMARNRGGAKNSR